MTAVAATRRTPQISGIGVAHDMLVHGLTSFTRIADTAIGDGDIVKWRSGHRHIFAITHPDYIEHVLREHADRYEKSVEYQLVSVVLGRSLFTDDGASWRRHRTMINPLMSRRHLNGMVELMIEPIESYVAALDAQGSRFEVEMVQDMTALTLDVVGAALFGHELGSVARRIGGAVTTGLRFGEIAARATIVAAPPGWSVRVLGSMIHHVPMPVPLPVLDRAQGLMNTIDDMVWQVIRDREANPTEADDLLGLLLRARDDDGALSTKRIRDEATTFMIAGHETTANGLAWMWYLLGLNSEARERMYAEIDTVLDGRRPTADDIPALPWTTACLREALRFFSPVWMIPRSAVKDDVIDGHRIPRGSTVTVPVNSVHHDKRWWPNPEQFDPSRFLGDVPKTRPRFAYLPFGAGQRVCIGMSFALMEGTLIAALMAQHFRFDVVPGHPVQPEATLTLRPRDGVRMVARRRDPLRESAVAA